MLWLTWLLTLIELAYQSVRLGPARVRAALVSEYLFTGGGSADASKMAGWFCAAGWFLVMIGLVGLAFWRRK